MASCHEEQRTARSLLLLLGLPMLMACGNLTAGGVGEASVAVSGDAPDDVAAPLTSVVTAPAEPGATIHGEPWGGPLTSDHLDDDGDEDPEGEIDAELSVFLASADDDLTPLTDGDVQVQVDLQGVEEPEIGSRTVSATTYTNLRMVFTEIEVEVDAGLIVDGMEVTGPIDVEIDDVTLTVDKALSLEVADGERVELLIDLNAESWLLAVDPATGTVDAQIFADLVTVRVR